MAKPSDQVFQLSLTEIAFTVVFILMLLLGWMLFKSEDDKKKLETQSADVASSLIALEEAKGTLSKALSQAGVAKPDEVISELTSKKVLIQERETLKKRIDELDARLTTLTEIEQAIGRASGQGKDKDKDKVIQEQIESALGLQATLQKELDEWAASTAPKDGQAAKKTAPRPNVGKEAVSAIKLKAALEKELGKALEKGKEAQIAKELADAPQRLQDISKTPGSAESLKKDNADLRGQVAFLKGKLGARGGRDYPPCWAEEKTGKIEYLFTIEIQAGGLRITPSWPPSREADARALPGLDQLLIPGLHSLPEFNARMQGIDRDSKAKDCRHYVYLRNRVNQLDVFNLYRYGVENFFYKFELRT